MGKQRKRKEIEASLGDGDEDRRHRKERKKQRKESKKEKTRTCQSAMETEQAVGESTAELSTDAVLVVGKYDLTTTDTKGFDEPTQKLMKKEKKKKSKDSKTKKLKDSKKKKESDRNGDQESDIDMAAVVFSNHDKAKALDAQQIVESEALTGRSHSRKIVGSSAIEFYNEEIKKQRKETESNDKTKKRAQEVHTITLLLFYTYVEPVWDESTYNFMLKTLQEVGDQLQLTGRMRVAKEGLNCTLTGSHDDIVQYCTTLRKLRPKDFQNTEFKLTYDLPLAQKFPNLKVFKVVELVHYGLEGSKAPPIAKYQGTHLEPKDYHEKLAEKDTVVIDVRNHYEAAIGRFAPPNSQWLDPKMRKSTEFPAWLDKPETMEMMRGKQVMMYCTGGIRCERGA